MRNGMAELVRSGPGGSPQVPERCHQLLPIREPKWSGDRRCANPSAAPGCGEPAIAPKG